MLDHLDDTPVRRDEGDLGALPTTRGYVRSVHRSTPGMVEITVELEAPLAHPLGVRTLVGGDEFVYVMISREPGGIPRGYDMSRCRERDPGDPVKGAYYTVRRWSPSDGRLVLWAVDHGHPGSVGAWLASATPGAPLALWGPRTGFRTPPRARHTLLVADETGLAAVAALLECVHDDRRITAVLEVSRPAHQVPLPSLPGLRVVWVHRGDDPPGGAHLLQAVRSLALTGDLAPDAAFGAAESHAISAVRRHVRDVWGVPATRVLMTGYWRRGIES